ncbi:hypothetical protein ACQEVB_09470 [Pseudonocardia sp. CA-107938]|uniref:hypothetical protein n=1 Tax=Pseudonocardia sp. CA-107938 TaxID=3240021 RepID=UPI003D8C617B
MTVIAALQGETSGDHFLIAPHDGRVFPGVLALSTDRATTVTLRSVPDGRIVLSPTTCDLGTDPTDVTVHATGPSQSRGDTTIEIVEGGDVVATLELTCIEEPVVHFRGRFEARFATDSAPYNDNPAYTSDPDQDQDVAVASGWTWVLEGEPPFVPATGNVPKRIEMPVGREIRFNDPVALRPRVEPVVTLVDRVSGRTAAGEESFTAGDPLIGEPVDVGPHTYFAGNRGRNPADPRTEESYQPMREVLALFELHLGTRFSGGSAVGPFTHMATSVNERTRTPDSRPHTVEFTSGTDELVQFGLPPDVASVSDARIDALLGDYAAATPGTTERRNLHRRICHLLATVSDGKQAAVLAAAQPGEFDIRAGTIPQGWTGKQVFRGKVDADLHVTPDGSGVVAYLAGFGSFTVELHMFGFHSDELCAHHIGSLRPDSA